MLVLFFVALWFILRGDLLYVFPCVILFLCFSVLLVLRLPRLGKRELILVHFVSLFDLCMFGLIGFLFLLGSGRAAVCDCGTPWTFLLPFFFTLYWLPKRHKRPYKARFIANSSSCTTTVLSKLLTSCLTVVKNFGLDTMMLFTKGTELTIFGQLKILMIFSINLNLKTFRLLTCLHMILLHCILHYLIIL